MWGSYSLAMFPLMLLAIQMVGVSLAGVYWAITSDKDSWVQLQTTVASLLVSAAVVVVYFGLIRGDVSSWQVALPLFLIQIGAVFRISLTKNEDLMYYMVLIALSLSQIVFLILKIDFASPLPWRLIFGPIYAMVFVMICTLLWKLRYHKWSDVDHDTFITKLGWKAVMLTVCGVTGFLMASCLDKNYKLAPTLFIFSMILILMLTISYCKSIGEFVTKMFA